MNVRVLVLPATAESGLEVLNSLSFHREFLPISASSDPEYAKSISSAESYYLPSVWHPDFTGALEALVDETSAHIVFPCHDEICFQLRGLSRVRGAAVINHPTATLEIVRSKQATYRLLQGIVPTPTVFQSLDAARAWVGPLFIKPDRGQGSRGARELTSWVDLKRLVNESGAEEDAFFSRYCVSESVHGAETTVDCFTSADGELLFVGQRRRSVVRSGISVYTHQSHNSEVVEAVTEINRRLRFSGPWFAQFRLSDAGPKLLEVGPRISGSSGFWRASNVNLAVLAVHQVMNRPVSAPTLTAVAGGARSLSHVPLLDGLPTEVVVDYDDTVVLNGQVNRHALAMLHVARVLGIATVLVSRHQGDLSRELESRGLLGAFDKVHHLTQGEPKSRFVAGRLSWFFDDSFSEREEVVRVASARSMDVSAIPSMLQALLAASPPQA